MKSNPANTPSPTPADGNSPKLPVFAASPGMTIVTDLDGMIEACSPEAQELFGIGHAQLLRAQHIIDFIEPRHRQRFQNGLGQMQKNLHLISLECQALRKDGSPFDIEINAALTKYDSINFSKIFFVVHDITVRKENEKHLIEQKQYMDSIISSIPDLLFVINANGEILEWKAGKEDELSLPPEAFLHKNIAEVVPAPLSGRYQEGARQVLAGKTIAPLQYELPVHDFATDFEARLSKVGEDKVMVLIRNITAQKRADKELRDSEERYRSLVDSSEAVIYMTDSEGRFLFLNNIATQPFGKTPAEMIGMHIHDFFPLYQAELILADIQKVISDNEGIIRKAEFTLAAENRWYRTSIQPVRNENGPPYAAMLYATDITDVVNAEQKIRRSEEKYRNLFFNAPNPYLIVQDGCYIECNKAAETLMGCERTYIIGKRPDMFAPEYQSNGYNSAELVAESTHIAFLKGGHAFEFEHIRMDGTTFLVQVNLSVIEYEGRPALLDSWHDITQQRQSEQEIRNLSQAVEQSPVSIIITNTEGVIEYVNPASCINTGYAATELIGNKTSILKSGETSPVEYAKLWDTITQGLVWKGTFRNRRKNGTLYWDSSTIAPVSNSQGAITHYVAVKEDVSLKKKAEEEQIARQAAEEANRAKSMFISNMSHEIRTPLNAVIGFSQILMRDTSLGTKQREQIQTIARSGDYLLQLINSILDLSKIEAGQVSINKMAFNLHELLEDIQSLFGLLATNKGLQLHFERKGDMPRYLIADESKLRQILINLLGNAFKFTSSGGISARFWMERSAEELLFFAEVEDSGPGIPEDELEKIFDSFHQASAGKIIGGTGLGLTISRNLIELMGGRIEVQSEVGKGSLFRFRIPVTESYDECPQRASASLQNVTGLEPGTATVRILVVDDIQENRELLCSLLEPIGFQTQEAANGTEAVERFTQWAPHAVLMDLRMPTMNGYQAAKAIKAYPETCNSKIIAVTASAFKDDEKIVRDAGFDDYIRKPFRPEDIFNVLGKNLGLHYTHGAAPTPGTTGGAASVTQENINQVPPALRASMLQAVEEGDMSNLTKLINQVEAINPHLALGLQHLACQYDYDRLLAVLGKK